MSHDPFENFKKQKADSDKMDRKNLPSDNVGNVSNYFEVPEEIKNPVPEEVETPATAAAPVAASSTSAVKRLEALIQLLVRKGVMTEEELKAMLTLLG